MFLLRAISKVVAAGLVCAGLAASVSAGTSIDRHLSVDNKSRELGEIISGQPLDDLAYLRKATVDLIGRIPTFLKSSSTRVGPNPSDVGCYLTGCSRQGCGGSVDYFLCRSTSDS